MVAARRGGHTAVAHTRLQQRVEGAARLEAAGMLQQFELERDGKFDALNRHRDDRRAAHVVRNARCGTGDGVTRDHAAGATLNKVSDLPPKTWS